MKVHFIGYILIFVHTFILIYLFTTTVFIFFPASTRTWIISSNFIFFKPSIPPREFAAELMSFGIHIRGDFAQARISIGTMQQCQAAVAAMKQILTEYQKKA